MSVPTLILNFDLNGTLLATDEAGGKTEECMLSELIAKKTRSDWDDSKQNLTYYEYLKSSEASVMMTKQEAVQAKKQRKQKLCDFVQEYDQQFNGQLRQDMNAMSAALASQHTMVFNSFFALLHSLDQRQITYHIVLRTFGTDIKDVVPTLEKFLQCKFEVAEFKNDALQINEQTITDYQEMEQVMNGTVYLAVQDEHAPWFTHKEDWHYGKKFLMPTNLNQLSLFFDDNIEPPNSKNNIVQPIKVLNATDIEQIDPGQLFNTQLFRVDTEMAIIDKNYFINLVNHALKSYNY